MNTNIMSGLKPSRYNIFVEAHDELIFFNSATGVMASVSGSDRELIRQVLDKDIRPTITDVQASTDLVHKLKDAGYLVPIEKDEVKVIESASWAIRKDETKAYTLTLAPGIQCNLRCPYCFQNHEPKAMSRELQDSVVTYAEKYISRVPKFVVDWYGGEPLLYLPMIRSLTDRFRALCNASQTKYSATITTNGVLLTREVVDQLVEMRVLRAQITVDGPREIHDKRRPFTDGRGTYDTILENIQYASEKMYIRLRVNLDKTNYEQIPLLLEDLKARGLEKKVEVDLKQVVSSELRPWDDKTLSAREYAMTIVSLYGLALDMGFHIPAHMLEPSAAHCGADKVGEMMIDAFGYMYKCTDVYGPDDAVGRLLPNGETEFIPTKLKLWENKDPFGDQDCTTCEVLPICMGGCNMKRLNGKGDWCDNLRYNVRGFIELVHRSKKVNYTNHEPTVKVATMTS